MALIVSRMIENENEDRMAEESIQTASLFAHFTVFSSERIKQIFLTTNLHKITNTIISEMFENVSIILNFISPKEDDNNYCENQKGNEDHDEQDHEGHEEVIMRPRRGMIHIT